VCGAFATRVNAWYIEVKKPCIFVKKAQEALKDV